MKSWLYYQCENSIYQCFSVLDPSVYDFPQIQLEYSQTQGAEKSIHVLAEVLINSE